MGTSVPLRLRACSLMDVQGVPLRRKEMVILSGGVLHPSLILWYRTPLKMALRVARVVPRGFT